MSDLSQTVSCERLPQSTAARIERSSLILATKASSARENRSWVEVGTQISIPEQLSDTRSLKDLRRLVIPAVD
jgi:hypothetical protein